MSQSHLFLFMTVASFLVCGCQKGSDSSANPLPTAPPARQQATVEDFMRGNFTPFSVGRSTTEQGWVDASGVKWTLMELGNITPKQIQSSDPCARYKLKSPTLQRNPCVLRGLS